MSGGMMHPAARILPPWPGKPYDAEKTKAWLQRREYLRQVRDNPDTPKAAKWAAVNQLESGE